MLLQADATANAEIYIEDGSEALLLDCCDHPDDMDVLSAALVALVEDLIATLADDWASHATVEDSMTDADVPSAPLATFEDLIAALADDAGAAFDDSDLNGLDPILNWDILYDAELAELIDELMPFFASADETLFGDDAAGGLNDASWLGIDDDTLLVFLDDGSVYAATDLEHDGSWIAMPILLSPTSLQPPDTVSIQIISTVSGVVRSVLAQDLVTLKLFDYQTDGQTLNSTLAADIVAVQMALRSYLGSLRLTDTLTSPNDKLKKPDKATLQ